MTDKEIIKGACRWKLCSPAQDIINHQQAEIERKDKKIEELSEVLSDTVRIRYAEAKAEAIKEFAERLKEESNFIGLDGRKRLDLVTTKTIDNLVKEMIGELG